MIISASRRTDIPAFYAEWFINRIRAGYCAVPNPFNPSQVSQVSLRPEDVEVIVFWTRNPLPILPYLGELDQRGYGYYFLYTVMNNPREIDPKSPPLKTSLKTFQKLADRIGPQKVVWRYDPIFFSTITGPRFHRKTYKHIAQALSKYTRRSVISITNVYRKTRKRLQTLESGGVELQDCEGEAFGNLMAAFAKVAHENGMAIFSCAEESGWRTYGILPGKCIDDAYIKAVFGLEVSHKKDPSQRKACGCIVSKDIGMYDSCIYGCIYCYATTSFEQAKVNYGRHHPNSPSLIGPCDAAPITGSLGG
jgi:predicted adenine nucleotide alpha hydrolase (AANH) superfamily ATPase